MAGRHRARLPGGRQARQRRRAAGDEGGGRRPRPAPAGASRCRWRCSRSTACCASRPRCSPSCATWCSCASRSARSGAWRSACSATCTACRLRFHLDRQTGGMTRDIERGTRGISTLLSYLIFSIIPGDPRVRAGRGGADRQVRLALRRHHLRRGRGLHRLHRGDHRVAHGDPPPRQRARLARQHARHRQPAQLRDGEVLRQRGVRGAALRRATCASTRTRRPRARPRSACSTSARA